MVYLENNQVIILFLVLIKSILLRSKKGNFSLEMLKLFVFLTVLMRNKT